MQKSKKTTNKSKSKTLNKKSKVTVKKSASTPKKTIAVIGLWHLGLVHTSALAKLGYKLIAIDPDQSIIKELQAGKVRLYEPGMTELLKKYHQLGHISYTTDFKAISKADLVIMAYDTPLSDNDDVILTSLVQSLKDSAPYLKSSTPFVVASQVPVGTCEEFQMTLRETNSQWKSGIVYMPENLRLGQAIERFLQPDLLVFGADDPKVAQKTADFFESIKTSKFLTSIRNAEMVKHAINFHLAVSITYANQLAQLAEALGADAVEVTKIIRHDPRIGMRAPLFPGLGFSGGTLARDVRLLLKKAQLHGIKAPLVESVSEINDQTFRHIINKLTEHLGDLKSKKVALLGITYKAHTSTLRRSPAVRLAEMLKKEKVDCVAFDPMADETETNAHKHLFSRKTSVESAVEDTDCIIVVTEWPEFQKLNFSNVGTHVKNRFLIDSKNFLDPVALKKAGFKYEGFGRMKG